MKDGYFESQEELEAYVTEQMSAIARRRVLAGSGIPRVTPVFRFDGSEANPEKIEADFDEQIKKIREGSD